MNTKHFTLILAALVVAGMCGNSSAQLRDRGNGLIYDADLDITFYNFTYGPTNWSDASSWASTLVVEGYDDWRLPKMKNDPPNYAQDCAVKSYSNTSASADRGWNKASSELGHLFFEELGGVSNYPANDCANPNSTFGLVNGTGPFQNLRSDAWFWMSNPEFGGSHYWVYNAYSVSQGTAVNGALGHAIAVRDGDVRSVEANTLEADSLALVALYNSTNGANWKDNTNWLVGRVGSWYGIALTADRVVRVTLNENNLSGTLPTEIGDLTSLNYLYLYTNQLTGEIPVEIGNLTNLSRLYLHGNQMTGGIPVEIGNLTNLDYLTLSDNQLTGEIPIEIGNLTGLLELWLRSNQLTGEIPSEIGNMTILTKLNLYNNQLSGAIPTTLGNLINLEYLYLDNNQLTGSIPSQLGGLTTNLTELWLSHNRLTGVIPTTLGALGNLTKLSLWDNQLTGEIPYSLRNMSSLTRLDLDENQLTGEIPVWWEDLSNLTELFLNGNLLTGEIPTEFGNIPGLIRLQLAENQLTGSIPASLGNITSLTELLLYGNQLTGEVPTALGNLSNLIWLKIGDNQLTGGIPTELRNLTGLKYLHLNGNQLDGVIPTWLGSLPNLEKLYLDNNQLTGTIPVELGSLTNLRVLSLWSNLLTGEIPVELGNLLNLEELGLSDNQLTGEIPVEIGNLTNLTSFYLHNNSSLYGALPTSLANLTSLGSFHFYGTGLCTPLDPAFQSWMLGIDDLQGTGCQAGITAVAAQDSLALVAIYNAADGANWTDNTNWLTGRVSGWNGVTVTGDRVTELSIKDNQMTGGIPVEIGSLTGLQVLSFRNNQMTGEIPVEVGYLTNLTSLSFSGNQLTGEIPPGLGNLTNLEFLYLSSNQLTGGIPGSIGSLTNLQRLFLSRNLLTGEIPVGIGALTKLQDLYLEENQLTGSIPGQIGDLESLMTLSLHNNQLSGSIPDELGNLTNLQFLRLYDNLLTGDIPATLANLGNLSVLQLGTNQLTGGFPVWLTTLDLSVLGLGDNQLSGEIPAEIGNLSNLHDLNLEHNQFTGEIPVEIGSLTGLQVLSVRNNQLTGEIPSGIGNLTGLEELDFGNNQLTGEVPSEFGNLINLTSLTLQDNPALYGTLPASLTNLTLLNTFHFNNTALCSSVDGAFQSWIQGINDVSGSVCTDTTAPSIPTGLFSQAGDGSITLNWSANSESDLASYRVYRGTSPSPTTLIATIQAGTTTYSDTGLTVGTTYYYRITAVDQTGNESVFSAEVSEIFQVSTDTTPPADPTGASSSAGDGEVTLAWTANTEPDFSFYRIYRGTSPSPTDIIATVPAGTNTFTDTGLTNGTTYYYRITAVDTSGNESGFSQEVSETPQAAADTTPPDNPVAPSGSGGDGEVTLNWTANTEPDFDYYRIYRGTSPAPTDLIATVPAGTSTFTDTGLTNGTTYYYRITAVDTSGNESGFSQEVSETPQGAVDTTAPAIPTGLSLNSSDASISLSWSTVGDVDLASYRLYRGTSPSPMSLLTTISTGTTTYTDTGLTNGTRYYYRITAVDASGNESAYSQERDAVPVQAQITVVRSQSFGSATLTSNFRMISLPGNSSTTVGSTFSGTAGSDWTAYWDGGSTSENYLVDYSASTTFRFTPGRGFWAISKNGWDVSSRTVNQVSLSSDGTYSISLHNGWNLIGNPFEFNVSWSFTTSLNGTRGTLNSYAGSYSASSRLEPYKGYYFFNRDGLTSLKIPYLRESSSSKSLEAGKRDPILVSSLIARDLDSELQAEVGYGSAQDALEGIDEYDRFAPPGYFDDLTMVIVSPESRFGYRYLSRDVRPPVKGNPVFDLLVMSSEPRILEFELKNPEDRLALSLYLIDPHGTIYGVGQQPVSIPVMSPKQSFTAVVGSLDLAESISAERLPPIPTLESLYPNPSSSDVSVEYVLPEDGHVVLQVYDILGRKVATLVDGQRGKGMHRIQWSGRDVNDQVVSSGLYFIKLNAGMTTSTRRLIRFR